jgi:catechol 2,3-dioxygenase-like lactoylglutathione lyase family enzyme
VSVTLTHIALHVNEFEESIDFYKQYCAMRECHRRSDDHSKVVWLSEPGNDFGHLGFAVETAARVDDLAEQAKQDGRLVWAPRAEPYPVGYYCGIRDPAGNIVEFSYGQPLGPGAEHLDA